MSDNDDAIEMGLIDYQGNILVDDYDRADQNNGPTNNQESTNIDLTPGKYLSSEGKYLRAKLTNNELDNSSQNLEVLHEKFNDNDSLALEVFCNKTSIGYIQKYSSDVDIDEFCFIDNKKINNLTLQWESNQFTLKKVLSHSENEILKLEKIREEKKAREKIEKKLKEEEKEEKLLYEEKLMKEEITLAKNIRDKEKLEKNNWDAAISVSNNPTVTESVAKILGRDVHESQSERINDKTRRLESLDEHDAVDSVIDFFGGDSEKLKQEMKQDVLNEGSHPIRDFLGNLFFGIFGIIFIIILVVGFLNSN